MRDRVLIAAALATLAVFLWPRIPQDPDYHVMADQRTCLGIANCFNVLSNIPFAIVGIAGLAATYGRGQSRSYSIDAWERLSYATLFVGVTATAAGSSYYHLAPDNARLVWDRLPMTLGFMGLLTALMSERVNSHAGRWLLGPLVVLGTASVLYWYWSELRDAGDLRLYVIVQFGSLIVIALLLALYKSRYTGSAYLVAGLIMYGAAKLLELADGPIFALGGIVSGHTLKHLAAAAAVACVAWMRHVRRPPALVERQL
jgi:predicted membrane channel-forming protein YqfA (hemolysin III family)